MGCNKATENVVQSKKKKKMKEDIAPFQLHLFYCINIHYQFCRNDYENFSCVAYLLRSHACNIEAF